MPVTIGGGLSFCGRELTAEELDLIRQITRDFSKLSLTELSFTVCELLEWRRPNGGLKSRECYFFLQALHERGWLPWLSLQPKKLRPRTTVLDEQSDAQSPITGPIGDYLPVQLQLLDNSADRLLFRQYIHRYHYLGYKVPYGAHLRYFVRSLQPPHPLLACLLFTSSAWKMAPRDAYIGWSPTVRQTNLPRVVNHSRFLILPWVRVRNLASHILSLAARQQENMAGQVPDSHPGQNQKAAVVDHPRQVRLAHRWTPADVGIARRHLPGRAGEQQTRQQGMGRLQGTDKITQVRAVGHLVAEIMITLDILAKQKAVGAVVEQLQLNREVIADRAGNRTLRIALFVEHRRTRTQLLRLQRQPGKPSAFVQGLKEEVTFPALQSSVGSAPLQQFANRKR